MNKIVILGRIYKNGSLGTSKNGKKYIGFSILDTKKEKTDTVKFRCVAFESVAERIDSWCKDGDQVLIFGSIENDPKTNAFVIIVSEFQRAGQKSDKPNPEDIEKESEEINKTEKQTKNEIPF